MAVIDNLVSYWALDEASGNATDAHGSNTLTDNASVGSTTGKVSGCRDFENGSSQYFSHSDNSDLSLGADQDFTWAGWVQLESTGGNRSFIAKSSDDFLKNVEYLIRYGSGNNRFDITVGNGTTSAAAQSDTFGAPSTATWYFVAAWHDSAANQLGISVNAGAADTTSWSSGTQDTSGSFSLGAWSQANNFHDGLLDEVGFWKRVLTSGDRTWLYNGGAGRSYADIVAESGGATKALPMFLRPLRFFTRRYR